MLPLPFPLMMNTIMCRMTVERCFQHRILGDVEIGSSGEDSQNLQNSKSHSSESNRKHLFAYTAEAIW